MDAAGRPEPPRGQEGVVAAPRQQQQQAGATATIAAATTERRNQKDDFAPSSSSLLAPPCLAAVRAHSAALAAEEAERAATLAAESARWDPDAWAATADKVLLPFVQPRGRGVVERALAPRREAEGEAPPSPPPPPPPPPPAITAVGDVVIVAAESPDDLSVLRIAPRSEAESAAAGRGGEASTSSPGDGGAAAPPAPKPAGDPAEKAPPSSATRCWVGTVRQLEAASGRALLGWLAPKRTAAAKADPSTSKATDGASASPLAAPPTSEAAAAERGKDDVEANREGRGEEDFSSASWHPAPGLPADWLDASSPGILSVARSLERGTARIPERALSAASGRLAALVAHDSAKAERERRRKGREGGGV